MRWHVIGHNNRRPTQILYIPPPVRYNHVCSGRSAARLARTVRVGEVGGSNPLAPTPNQTETSSLLYMSTGGVSTRLAHLIHTTLVNPSLDFPHTFYM